MLTRKINNTLLVTSYAAKFIMQMGFAVLLARLIWWAITPAYNEVYVDRVRVNQKDTSVKYIINRYPFGEVVIVKHKDETPQFSTLVKLHGVYVNGNNSMAFLEYSGKNMAVKVGGNISSDILLNKVEPDAVVISQGDTNATIKISRSNGMSGMGSGSPASNGMGMSSSYNNGQNGNMNGGDMNNQNNNMNNNSDLIEKRREMIEKFSRQEARDDSDN